MDLEELENAEEKTDIEYEGYDFDKMTVDNGLLVSPIGIPGNVDLSEEDRTKLTDIIHEYIRQVEEEDKSEFNSEIIESERTLNMVPDGSTEKPWDTACEYESTIVPQHCATISNALYRTLSVEPYFIGRVKGNQEKTKELTDFINDAGKNSFGYIESLGRLADIVTQTPGCIINPEWVREVRRDSDYEVITSIDGFIAKFPTAEDANMTESEYESEKRLIERNISLYKYHVCRYEYDVVVSNKCKWNVIHPSDFVMYPWNSINTELARLVGARFYDVFDNFVSLERDNFYFEGTAKKLKTNFVTNESISNEDSVKTYQDSINGIPSDPTLDGYRSKNYQSYRGVIRLDLNNDGNAQDYEFVLVYDEKILARFAPSRYNCKERNFYIASILPKTKSAWGTSVPRYLKNTASIVTTLVRQLVDSNTVANVPTFKGSFTDREWLEKTNQGMRFKPGKVFWLKGPGTFERFATDQINAQQTLMIIQYLEQNVEAMDGASRSLAGQPIADNPNAPGIKQAMMIQQSNFMVNRYIDNIRPSLANALRFTTKLYRQYLFLDAYNLEKVNSTNGKYESSVITRDNLMFLDDITTFDIRNSKVDDNSQLRMSNMLQDADFLMAIQQVNQNPLAVRTIVRNLLMNRAYYTIDEINSITGTEEQIRADVQEAAMAVAQSDQLAAMKEQVASTHKQGMEQIQNKLDNLVMGGSNEQGLEGQEGGVVGG